MIQNVGNLDRSARVFTAAALLLASMMAPWPLATRLGALALPAVYLLFTALRGTCLGYALLGRSTCPTRK